MSQLGLGVMINMLAGNSGTKEAVQRSIGKKILRVDEYRDTLRLFFTDGTGLAIEDDGQSCCESRYMTCDDDLTTYGGDVLVSIEVGDADDIPAEYDDCHEVQFLIVKTDRGVINCATHVEHNGYYGGFSIVAREFSHDDARD